jgi:hypothetical protein
VEQTAPSSVEQAIRVSSAAERIEMPLLRYFFLVGGALLALLFAADAYLPKSPAIERATATADLSMIRIRSDRKWPERIAFDTTQPTIIPPRTSIAEIRIQKPAHPSDAASKAPVREAFAQLPATSSQLQPADPRKAEPRRKRKSVARAYTGQPLLVAQQPRFGLFGNGIW